MKKIGFGIQHLKSESPKFVHWVSVTGAGLVTLLAGLNLQYPMYITEHMIVETAKILAAFRLFAQFLGMKKEVELESVKKPE